MKYHFPISPAENQLAEFVAVVLADTEDTWHVLFNKMGKTYREPTLVLFSGAVESACGYAQAAMGPFYCPADQKVYIDLSFYRDLKNRHLAPGDFAPAYVIVHEIGHHVQTLLGISEKVHSVRRRVSQVEGNKLSVMQELQADCFAGIWAHHANRARQILEEGDIEEALNAASAIGDDRLQQRGRGDTSHRILLPMEAPGSACAGLNRASRPVMWVNVIHSKQIIFSLKL